MIRYRYILRKELALCVSPRFLTYKWTLILYAELKISHGPVLFDMIYLGRVLVASNISYDMR
jgi:hypothetical protein